MSGRSAYVRAKNNQHGQSTKQTSYKQYSDFAPDDPYLYGYTGPPHSVTRPVASPNSSYVSNPPLHIRRQSHSSAGSTYGYPTAPHLHKPRPIVIASAIEKSDFRTHLDGMSSTLRGKLGGLMKGKRDGAEKGKRRPDTSSADSEFEFNSRSTELTTPSIGAVPSLTTSTTPSEGPGTVSGHQSYSIPTRSRQPQESVVHKIRRFEGGGKLPQLGWKSLSNVGLVQRFCAAPTPWYSPLTRSRTPNSGMRMAIRLFTCICVDQRPNHRPPFASIHVGSWNRVRKHSSINCATSESHKAGQGLHRTAPHLWTLTTRRIINPIPTMTTALLLPCVPSPATAMRYVQPGNQSGKDKGPLEGSDMNCTFLGLELRLAFIPRYGISPPVTTSLSCTMPALWSAPLCTRP